MANIFDTNRMYFPEDPELRVFGSTEKLAQWRHRMTGPAFIRIGRRIGYHGTDLNAYLSAQAVHGSVSEPVSPDFGPVFGSETEH